MNFLTFLTKGDKILIVLILIVCSMPLFFLFQGEQTSTKQIVVKIDSEKELVYDLNYDKNSIFFSFDIIKDGVKYKAKLETKEGKVRLLRLPPEIAPLAIHSETGWIDKTYQMIVALPAKLTITIRDSSGLLNEDIDIISH